MILDYRSQDQNTIAEQRQHEAIENISKEEWIRLVCFIDEDIPRMTSAVIPQRIAALKSIVETPHFSFNWELNNDPKFNEFVSTVYETTLNGQAGYKIYILEKYLISKSAQPSQPELK